MGFRLPKTLKIEKKTTKIEKKCIFVHFAKKYFFLKIEFSAIYANYIEIVIDCILLHTLYSYLLMFTLMCARKFLAKCTL